MSRTKPLAQKTMEPPSIKALPVNLPRTFLPERRLLTQLMRFAAANGQGNRQDISDATGIPTGAQSGKVEPMLDYAQGMGIINATVHRSHWQLSLTTLGTVILREDPFLSEPLTAWLLHLMLCRRNGLSTPASGIADAWFTLFAESSFRLGHSFTHADYLAFLRERHGEKSYLRSLSSIVLRTYFEEGCLNCSAQAAAPLAFADPSCRYTSRSIQNQRIIRQAAPLETAFFPAYTAYFHLVWDELFATETQLALDEFSQGSRFFTLLHWDESSAAIWLNWMSDHRLVQLDRHTGTAMLLRLCSTESLLEDIYSTLL